MGFINSQIRALDTRGWWDGFVVNKSEHPLKLGFAYEGRPSFIRRERPAQVEPGEIVQRVRVWPRYRGIDLVCQYQAHPDPQPETPQ